jgi:hypothetical protein
MRDTCICKGDQDTCGIHAGYMRNTCILRGNQDTCGIHAEYMEKHAKYMRDTWGILGGYMRDTFYLGGLGECIDAIMESSAPIRLPMSSLCRNGSAPTNTLQLSIFYFVMVTLTALHACIPAGLPPWLSAKRSNFSCSTERVELALFFPFGISPWDPLPWIM